MVSSLTANVDIAGSPKCWRLYIFMVQHEDHGNLDIFEGQISDTERRPRPHHIPESRSLATVSLYPQVSSQCLDCFYGSSTPTMGPRAHVSGRMTECVLQCLSLVTRLFDELRM